MALFYANVSLLISRLLLLFKQTSNFPDQIQLLETLEPNWYQLFFRRLGTIQGHPPKCLTLVTYPGESTNLYVLGTAKSSLSGLCTLSPL